MDTPTTKVFISYSHDTPQHSDRILRLAWALQGHGVDVELDQFHSEEIVDWPRWCSEQISREHCDFVVCVCTAEYRRRIEGKVPPERGKGVYWEGSLLDDDLYDDKGNERIIPVLLDDEAETSIVRFLRGWTHCRIETFALEDAGYEHLLRIVTRQPRVEKNALGKVPVLPAKRVAARQTSVPARHASRAIDVSRILKYAPSELIGRENDLRILNDAWAKAQNPVAKRPRVLTFVALGGEGKTSLVAKWTAQLAEDNWPGCDAAFAWSFYSQGTREQLAASSDLFLKEALAFFGDDDDKAFAASAAGAFEKGQWLARVVGRGRNLLILDGLEPLQYPPTPPHDGALKDQGIGALLKGLAFHSEGLCVVTTRYSLPDLKAFWQTTTSEVELLRLSREAGIHLLGTLGVRGSTEELAATVEDVVGHALTLTLLGGYLGRAFDGDIRQRDRVKFAKADEKIDGGHAFRTMAAYEQWLLDGGDEGQREVAILRMMGLFDRPADAACLEALRREPIAGLSESLAGMSDEDWRYCLSGLERARLVTVNRNASGQLVSLDTHPHIRAYFAKQLSEKHVDTWRAAHRRLYEHLYATTPDKPVPTLEDLQPLYEAIAHGCHAGLQQQACDDVLYRRIHRGDRAYSTRTLGAFGSDLAAIACFFDRPWDQVSSALTTSDQAWMISSAGFCLSALGRSTEALEPMRSELKIRVRLEDWGNAAITSYNLSSLELTLGQVSAAIGDAEQSVINANRTDDSYTKMMAVTAHADGLHQAGQRTAAETHFRRAEQIQADMQPSHPLLYSLYGFQYCDLLLAAAERKAWVVTIASGLQRSDDSAACNAITKAVSERATQTLKWSEEYGFAAFSLALDRLTLARAALYDATVRSGAASRRPDSSALELVAGELDAAVSGVRRAGTTPYVPNALLTRAWLRYLDRKITGRDSAQADLDEAWDIAERGPMKLFLADIHLHRARLFFREPTYPWESPAADLAAARTLIETCGYWRRKEELEDAEAAIRRSP